VSKIITANLDFVSLHHAVYTNFIRGAIYKLSKFNHKNTSKPAFYLGSIYFYSMSYLKEMLLKAMTMEINYGTTELTETARG
jgi:hypothetical protein